jgi:hypothetical protein
MGQSSPNAWLKAREIRQVVELTRSASRHYRLLPHGTRPYAKPGIELLARHGDPFLSTLG